MVAIYTVMYELFVYRVQVQLNAPQKPKDLIPFLRKLDLNGVKADAPCVFMLAGKALAKANGSYLLPTAILKDAKA